jgi:hypothetical protein
MPVFPLIAVVEIGPGAAAILLAVVALIAVGLGGAFWLLSRGRRGPHGTTEWRFDFAGELPVGKPALDRLATLTEAALAPPALAPETRAAVDSLGSLRRTLAGIYRAALIVGGIGGLVLAFVLFRGADAANMQGLPAAIVLLLSLGALFSGLIPSRTVDPVTPVDPDLFKNISVQVSRQPLTVHLSQFELIRAKEMLRQGATLDAIARAVVAEYDRLGGPEKHAIQQTLAKALEG